MKLVRPEKKYEASWKRAVAEFRKDSKSIKLWEVLGDPDDLDKCISAEENHSKGKELPSDWVPYDLYWLVDGEEIVGVASVRHSLNDFLLREGGHVGYEIIPSKRGIGYGNKILELSLAKAGDLGLCRVLVSSFENNNASRKIIENNGGAMKNRIETEEGITCRYWIDLFVSKM